MPIAIVLVFGIGFAVGLLIGKEDGDVVSKRRRHLYDPHGRKRRHYSMVSSVQTSTREPLERAGIWKRINGETGAFKIKEES